VYEIQWIKMHGETVKLSSTCFEQIVVNHQEVISVHAAYIILSCIYGCLAANTMCCVYRNNLLMMNTYLFETVEDSLIGINKWEKVCILLVILTFIFIGCFNFTSFPEGTLCRRNIPQTYCISRPIRRTFSPEKCDLNLTCVLCAEGKYYFQTYEYLYVYYTTSFSWDSEICFQIMRSGITACGC